MTLSDSSTALFVANEVGDGLLHTLQLPAEIFPRTGTWNQFSSLSEPERALLSNNTFNSKPVIANKSHLTQANPATLSHAFISANSNAVRFSPLHRLWSQDDLFAIPQRWDTSCHLLVLRMEGSPVDEPFICFAGPMATPFQGSTYSPTTVFNLNPDDPLPTLHSTKSLPTTVAPTTFSLNHAPRLFVETQSPAHLLPTLRTNGALVTSLTSDDAHRIIPVFDITDTTYNNIKPEESEDWSHLWIPATSTEPPTPDSNTIKPWLQTHIVPPNPKELLPWESGPVTTTRSDAFPYRPTPHTVPARMQPPHTPAGNHPGFLLVPTIIRLPATIPFPIGLVLRPSAINPRNIQALLADLTGHPIDTYSWMDNPLLTSWIMAVATDPSAFAIPVWPHSIISKAFPSTAPEEALSIRLHQEWSILNQLIWDHAFAHASGQGSPSGNQSLRLTHYAQALTSANNSDNADSLAQTWGFIRSTYNHPFLVRLRPPSQISARLIPGRWETFTAASPSDLPTYIRTFPSLPIDIRERGKPKIQPLTLPPPEPNDPSDQPNEIYDIWDARKNLFDTPTTPPPHNPAKRAPDPATFDFSSPAKRRATSTREKPPPTASPYRRSPRLAHQPQASPFARSTRMSPRQLPVPVFDPNDTLFAASSTPAAADPWRLPYLQDGQTPLPPSAKQLSPALATALRQCDPVIPPETAAHEDKALVAFHFRPALMLSTNVPHRDIVHRIAHWGAYRCVTLTDPKPVTVSVPLSQYPSDWWCAPGHLNPALLPHFQEAYRRSSSHHAMTNMTEWFRQRAAGALRDTSKRGPPGRIHPSWFTPTVMTAILSFSFKPGTFVNGTDVPTTFLTPWHFITSTPETYSATDTRIPQGGLEALKIFDIIHNMIFLFHLCFNDVYDASALGAGHSTFSRFSPLAGRLLFLAHPFSNRSFQLKWDAHHSREAYTKAVFSAISNLWNIFDTWQEEKFSPGDTYRAASAASNPNLILLNPIVDATYRQPLVASLQQWDADIAVFTLAQLERSIPRDGIFNELTPDCFLSRNHRHPPSSTNRPGDHRPRSHHTSQEPSRPHTRRNDHSTGESTRTLSARSPMFQKADQSTKPLFQLLRDLNFARSAHNKIHAPRITYPNSTRPKQLCFRFCTANSGGCTPRDGQPCPHAHIDLADPQQCRQQAPDKFFADIMTFLATDDIKQHYKPTQELQDFTGRR